MLQLEKETERNKCKEQENNELKRQPILEGTRTKKTVKR